MGSTALPTWAATRSSFTRPTWPPRAPRWGTPLKANTLRVHLILVRLFFDRVIEWRWPHAPPFYARVPHRPAQGAPTLAQSLGRRLGGTLPGRRRGRHQQVPSAVRRSPGPHGPYAWASCALWPRRAQPPVGFVVAAVPVGKLANDRYVPAHPRLVELITAWQAHHDDHRTGLLITHNGRPLDRYQVSAGSASWPKRPGSATSTPISCATPWPPRPNSAMLRQLHHSTRSAIKVL